MQAQHKTALVIHGGAGTITRENMTPELEKQYRDKMEEALKAGDYAASLEAAKLLGRELHMFSEKESTSHGGPGKGQQPVQIGQLNINALDKAMSDVGQVIEGAVHEERTQEPEKMIVKDSHYRSRSVEGPEELESGGHRFFDGMEQVKENHEVRQQRHRGESLNVALPPDDDDV
jgi:hypothetical protein